MNTIDISYENNDYKKLAPKKFVLSYLEKVLDSLDLRNVEFSVSFVGEESIRQMNRDYRNIDLSTDILSFASEDELDGFAFIQKAKHKRVLGDMVICPEVLRRNSEAFSVTEQEELRRLLIHGVLHLSGENHQTNDVQNEPMLQKQEEILVKLG